ncbi:UvrB/UvrC motif-containing protein [Verrucomicrobia bacterium]|nr:UvrB/UvrC motif-containing protein [Verrucomicrobiota bacterium]
MNCDVCNENHATVYLTQIVKGEMQKVNLCEDCAKEKGVTDPTGFALADALLGMDADQEKGESVDLMICKACGFSHSEFKKTGRFGCSECYSIFQSGLESLVKAMHKGTRHFGKVPSRYRVVKKYNDQITELKDRLLNAINDENFEEAAKLRDEIKLADADFNESNEGSIEN